MVNSNDVISRILGKAKKDNWSQNMAVQKKNKWVELARSHFKNKENYFGNPGEPPTPMFIRGAPEPRTKREKQELEEARRQGIDITTSKRGPPLSPQQQKLQEEKFMREYKQQEEKEWERRAKNEHDYKYGLRDIDVKFDKEMATHARQMFGNEFMNYDEAFWAKHDRDAKAYQERERQKPKKRGLFGW